MPPILKMSSSPADTVAKVFLGGSSSPAGGAAIEKWVIKPPCAKLTGDSGSGFEAALVGEYRLFVLWQKISRSAFWTFAALSGVDRKSPSFDQADANDLKRIRSAPAFWACVG